MPTDPVCGMYVRDDSPLHLERDGTTYYFCSKDCMDKFSEPEAQVVKLRRRLYVAFIFTIPVLALTYIGTPEALRNYILLALASPVQFYSGSVFYVGAYHSIRSKSANMDILITLGSSVAYFFSFAVSIVRTPLIPPGEVYFDASSVIITLILVGQYSESLSKLKANVTARSLLDLIPGKVHVFREGSETEDVAAEKVKKGDVIVVYPGEYIPCDGRVVSGESEVEESIITGEQKPLLKQPGTEVSSGTVNLNGPLGISVDRIGKGSSLDEINELIKRASMGRTSFQRIVDTFSSVFVPAIIVIALASSLFWLFFIKVTGISGILIIPMLAFVSVVVIACPCSIGLATPISLLVSSDTALSRGIVVKNPSAMERLTKIDYVILDKTGTITEATPNIDGINSPSMPEDVFLQLIYSLEQNSRHPISKALIEECRHRGIKPLKSGYVKEIPGEGIEGTVNNLRIKISRTESENYSSFTVYSENKEIGKVKLSYRLKPGIKDSVGKLLEHGINVGLLSGDSRAEVERIALEAGIHNYWYRKTPDEKVKKIQELQEEGHYVMFLGDGINDAAAIATADVGAAVGTGTDIARKQGDLIMMTDGIETVYTSKVIATETLRKIRQNIIYAIGYNTVLIPVAAGVLVPIFGFGMFSFLPFLSAMAMGFSSTSVVLNSLRLRKRLGLTLGNVANKSST